MAAKKKILVVDDEVELCEALCFDINEAGYIAVKAHSGRQAIELLSKQSFDLIITDVKMPDGDGIELLKDIKSKNNEEPVVLLVSGFTDIRPEEAYNLGAEGVFPKPFKIENLIGHIEKCLLPRERRWQRVSTSMQPTMCVAMKLFGFDGSKRTSLLNVGRGGMCLSFNEGLPTVGQVLSFEITFSDGDWSPIAGSGIVRWRMADATADPKRVGIEFLELTKESLPRVLELIEYLNPRSYIPEQ